jgi:hypothetical protein
MYIYVLAVVALNNIFSCCLGRGLKAGPDLSNLRLLRHSQLLGEGPGPAMSLARTRSRYMR